MPSVDLTFPSYIDSDLRGWDIWFSNSTPTIGDVITISSRIHNIGELEASDVVVKLFDNDTEIGSVRIPSIPSNSYKTASISWTAFPEGLHKITVIIDPDNTIAESNKFNNKATRYINVYLPYEPPSELYIYSEDIVFSNTNPDWGENVIIYATIHNNGPAPAQNFNVTFYLNNKQLDYRPIDNLSAEASQTVSIHWTVNVGNGSYVIRVEIDPEYAIRDSIRTNNTATKAIIVGMPPKAPPVACIGYTPIKPVIGDHVIFWDSCSYDPDGGIIVKYQWELYGLTTDGDIIFPPLMTDEKEIVSHTFSSKGEYLMKLIVTDDEGETASTSLVVEVTDEWIFAIITDLHIGRGYPDYGGKGIGTEDMQVEGQDYYLTERLQNTVKWITNNRDNYNIRFVVVLGDISDSGEYSELKKAKTILDNLNEENIPYIPVIGNHDVCPSPEENEENQNEHFFGHIFGEQIGKLMEDASFNLRKQPKSDILNFGDLADLQNYVFEYKGTNFIVLDCVSRTTAPEGGVLPNAVLWNSTLYWLSDNLHAGQPTIILSHHPLIAPRPDAFINPLYILTINEKVKISTAKVLANFAGHIHGYYNEYHILGFNPPVNPHFMDANKNWAEEWYIITPANMPVVTTEALMVASNEQTSKGIIRLVEVKNGEISNYDIVEGEFPALNPYFKPTASVLLNETTLYQKFEAYAFTKIFTDEFPLSYTMNFGDGKTQTRVDASGEPVPFDNYYSDWSPDEIYTVTLTVTGRTPDGNQVITEKIVKTMTFTVSPFMVIGHSPIDIIVTDPDGLTISKQQNEIPDSTYVEMDINGDGDMDDIIAISYLKIGNYFVTVEPEPGAEPTATYTLKVLGKDATIILAENVSVSQIPTEPYVFNFSELNIPPTTVLNIGEPRFMANNTTYLTSATFIELIAEDNPGGSGLASTAYKIYNSTYDSGWITYIEPFLLTALADGTYTIEFYSTDNLNNTEQTNSVQITLFSWNYVFTDSYGRGTTLKINTQHKLFQFIAPDKTFPIKHDPDMYIGKHIIAINYEDNEIQIYAISIDKRVNFCIAYAKDKQTGKDYWLIDKPNLRTPRYFLI